MLPGMACVLVIDDEPGIRTLLRHALEREGHQVLEAENGRKGMRALRDAAVDVVITDIIMPEQEGFETIFELRRTRPDLKIIAISGGGRRLGLDVLPMAARLGADRTLAKPFKMSAVAAAVAELVCA